jgi:hypothetical protein
MDIDDCAEFLELQVTLVDAEVRGRAFHVSYSTLLQRGYQYP